MTPLQLPGEYLLVEVPEDACLLAQQQQIADLNERLSKLENTGK